MNIGWREVSRRSVKKLIGQPDMRRMEICKIAHVAYLKEHAISGSLQEMLFIFSIPVFYKFRREFFSLPQIKQ